MVEPAILLLETEPSLTQSRVQGQLSGGFIVTQK